MITNKVKKVTVFGEHTHGGIDYLDNFSIDLPSKRYDVSIATKARSILDGDKKRDYIGIMPDVNIPESEKDWVEFVEKYYDPR